MENNAPSDVSQIVVRDGDATLAPALPPVPASDVGVAADVCRGLPELDCSVSRRRRSARSTSGRTLMPGQPNDRVAGVTTPRYGTPHNHVAVHPFKKYGGATQPRHLATQSPPCVAIRANRHTQPSRDNIHGHRATTCRVIAQQHTQPFRAIETAHACTQRRGKPFRAIETAHTRTQRWGTHRTLTAAAAAASRRPPSSRRGRSRPRRPCAGTPRPAS